MSGLGRSSARRAERSPDDTRSSRIGTPARPTPTGSDVPSDRVLLAGPSSPRPRSPSPRPARTARTLNSAALIRASQSSTACACWELVTGSGYHRARSAEWPACLPREWRGMGWAVGYDRRGPRAVPEHTAEIDLYPAWTPPSPGQSLWPASGLLAPAVSRAGARGPRSRTPAVVTWGGLRLRACVIGGNCAIHRT